MNKKLVGFLVLAVVAFTGGWLYAGGEAVASNGVKVVMYQNPSCGCCSKWMEHMQANGFDVEVHKHDVNVNDIKRKENITPEIASCHTAYIEGYLVEGHVPARDINRLLAERPDNIRGLTVPGMPVGTPGMEQPDGRVDQYDVLAFDSANKTSVYASY
ncbi:MAG: DUF411 domain-containing protein [Acidobacteria bacterium]|nr:DUF411 domain-containing protein [Acidobacteriota bacterium]